MSLSSESNSLSDQGSTSPSFLGNFFTRISQFSFELISERERDNFLKSCQIPVTTVVSINHQATEQVQNSKWVNFIITLGNISLAERNYMNLAFLAPKGFLRKENNTKAEFEVIKQELKKMNESSLAANISEILIYLGTRQEMIDFYEKLALFGIAKNMEITDLIADIDLIYEKFQEERNNFEQGASNLQALFKTISWECEILMNLLKSYGTMVKWEFLSSLISIQEGQRKLTEWSNHLQINEANKRSTSFLKSATVSPLLYQWIWRLKDVLFSKFSFIFYDILAKNSNPAFDIRQLVPKLHKDYYTRIVSFLKKTDASSFCLVFDARGTTFQSNGYQHPARKQEQPQGVDSFPAIFAYPSKPTTLWPSIIMLLTEKMESLNNNCFGFYDSWVQSTFFIQKYDPNMYILCIYNCKKSEKDSYIIKFLAELSTELTCLRIFTCLKTGLK